MKNRNNIIQFLRSVPGEWLTLTALLIFALIFGLNSDAFLRPSNLLNIARQSSIIGIVSIAVLFTMLVGGIDLSIGSMAGLSGIVTAGVMSDSGNMWLGILAGLGAGLLIGTINGLVITQLGIQDIIATLAMLFVAHGLIFAYSGGHPIYEGLDERFFFIGQGNISGISMPIIIAVLIAALVFLLLKFTRLGRQFYAVGGNPDVAFAAGINVKKVKVIAYALSGVLSGVAGVIMTARLGSGQPAAGESFLLDAVAAVILGGASLAGGMGGIPGTIIGVVIIGVLSNGLTLAGAQYYVQEILKGVMIVFAVLLNSLRDLRR